MLSDVLSTLIFLYPFVAIAFLCFTKTAQWRQRLIKIWAFTAFLAFGWYITLLWGLRKIESINIAGLHPNPEVIPLHMFVSSSWLPIVYAVLVVVLGYIAMHYTSRNVSRRSG